MTMTMAAIPQTDTRIIRLQGGGLRFLAARDFHVVTWPFEHLDTGQQWRVVALGDGACAIQQVSSGRFLDTCEFRAVTSPPRDDDSQRWRLEDLGGGFLTIEQVSSGRFLEATVAGRFDVFARPPGDNEQTWRIGDP